MVDNYPTLAALDIAINSEICDILGIETEISYSQADGEHHNANNGQVVDLRGKILPLTEVVP